MSGRDRILSYMQIDQSSIDMGMSQQFLDSDNVESLFQEMGGIAVPQGMQVYIFIDGGFFQSFAHDPAKPFDAVSSVWFFSIEQVDMGFFSGEIFFKSIGYVIRQRDDAIFFVLTLPDMNGFTLKVDIAYFQVNNLLSAKASRIDQGQQNTMFEQFRRFE